MLRYVIRHGHTGVKRDNREQYGRLGPPLSDKGFAQARALRSQLVEQGIDLNKDPVAVSEFLRAHQTGLNAGFVNLVQSPLLNEISTGLPPQKLKIFIQNHKLPQIVLDKASLILENPPEEKVWITHGLVIMGLRQLLGLPEEPFDPPHAVLIPINIS